MVVLDPVSPSKSEEHFLKSDSIPPADLRSTFKKENSSAFLGIAVRFHTQKVIAFSGGRSSKADRGEAPLSFFFFWGGGGGRRSSSASD